MCSLINFALKKRLKKKKSRYKMYRESILKMCVNTYFDTICVHLVKFAYSLPKMRTIKLTDKLEFVLLFSACNNVCVISFNYICYQHCGFTDNRFYIIKSIGINLHFTISHINIFALILVYGQAKNAVIV